MSTKGADFLPGEGEPARRLLNSDYCRPVRSAPASDHQADRLQGITALSLGRFFPPIDFSWG